MPKKTVSTPSVSVISFDRSHKVAGDIVANKVPFQALPKVVPNKPIKTHRSYSVKGLALVGATLLVALAFGLVAFTAYNLMADTPAIASGVSATR